MCRSIIGDLWVLEPLGTTCNPQEHLAGQDWRARALELRTLDLRGVCTGGMGWVIVQTLDVGRAL